MNRILSEFNIEMDLLKLYIDFQNRSYKNQSKIEKNNPDSVLKSLTISKIKQFDFNSHVISMYGAFENFVEQLITKYLEEICSITTSYKLLPIEIQKNNLNKTFEIIKQIDYRKNKNLRPEKLIEILHKNINENSPILNLDAFKNHSSNFRISIIDNYFTEIGIKNISSLVRQFEPLKSHLEKNVSDFSSKKNIIIFQILEHICDLRNDIAHGVKNIQLINKSILFDYIDFMKILAESLYELTNSYYLSKVYELNKEEIEIINVFNKEILCFNSKGKIINKKTKILVKSENHFPSIYYVNILDIQHNKISIDKTSLNDNIEIGIQVDKRIKDTMKFKLCLY
jgi:ribosomal protein S15P/S13E